MSGKQSAKKGAKKLLVDLPKNADSVLRVTRRAAPGGDGDVLEVQVCAATRRRGEPLQVGSPVACTLETWREFAAFVLGLTT